MPDTIGIVGILALDLLFVPTIMVGMRNFSRLKRSGRTTHAEVIDKWARYPKRAPADQVPYVRYFFITPEGERVESHCQVKPEEYAALNIGNTVEVCYHPEKPHYVLLSRIVRDAAAGSTWVAAIFLVILAAVNVWVFSS